MRIIWEKGEWLPPNPGRAPPTVEAYYELNLDAMRLPQGLICEVKLPDGTITEVPGRGLQRPPSSEMDDFEKRYWSSKPVVTHDMATQFVVRRCSDLQTMNSISADFNNLGVERFVFPCP